MASKPARRIHNTDSLGASGYNSFFKNSAYSLSSTAPRYILVLPIMWKSTKPISAIPEMAIAYFLPTAVPYRSSSNGRRGRGAAAVPVTGWREGVVVLIRGVVSLLTLVLKQPPSAPNHCICRVKPVSSSRFLSPTTFGRYGPIHGKSS